MGKLDTVSPIICNLGTGTGFSVREIIAAAEKVAGKKVEVKFGPRRAGDAIALYADPSKAKSVLGWEAKHKDPEEIIRSAWNWFKDHPTGTRRSDICPSKPASEGTPKDPGLRAYPQTPAWMLMIRRAWPDRL